MIPNWKIRLIVFVILAVPLTYFGYQSGAGTGPLSTMISTLFGFGMSCIALFAAEPAHFPDRLARTFTTVKKIPQGLQVSSTWQNGILTLTPLLPLLTATSLAGLFDHSLFPDRPSQQTYYTIIGLFGFLGLMLIITFLLVGFRCRISSNYIKWVWTHFGKDVIVREYYHVRMVEYAATNGKSGGPVVTIEYEKNDGDHDTAKLKFRNVYGYTREQFGDLLVEYLGEPDRRVFSPTSR